MARSRGLGDVYKRQDMGCIIRAYGIKWNSATNTKDETRQLRRVSYL
jgi:hypothetical protein